MRALVFFAVLVSASLVGAQTSTAPKSEQIPRSSTETPNSQTPKATSAEDPQAPAQSPPRQPDESSSRDTIIDLTPPPGDAAKHPGSDSNDDSSTGVTELKKWDPHKAEKNVEVGDYYAKQKNYKGAISRYREALEYKPRDAVATFRLAQALEKNGELTESIQRYQEYLQILRNGPFAADARKGIDRLQQKTQRSAKQ